MDATPPGAEWNAQAYDRLSSPHQTWGATVLDRLHPRGDETALDLGCGSGRLTEELLRRLPRGHVIAVDRSANMLRQAEARLQPLFGDRVEFVQRSLERLGLNEVADLAFSNAALHWIQDHPRLFRAIFRALRPGGRLVAQCGGGPNIARLRARAQRLMDAEPYRPYFEGWDGPWEFADADTTRDRLHAAGFVDVETGLVEAPVTLDSAQRYRDFLENVIFGSHLARLPRADLRAAFLDGLTEQSLADHPPLVLDYWRLNLSGRRPA